MNLGDKLKLCPFCGRKMVFHKNTYVNKNGKEITEQYYLHEDYDIFKEENCILDEIKMPFSIGAGDANPKTGYIGEYAEKWSTRKPMDKIVEQLEMTADAAHDEIMARQGSEQYYDGYGDGVNAAIEIIKGEGAI